MATSLVTGSSGKALTFSNLLADGVSREFIWGCELTKDKPSATWADDIDCDAQDYLRHTLFLKQAVLGANALKHEKNVVIVETVNYNKEKIKQPIISLTSGYTESCMLDLNFAGDIPLTFTLIAGSGPLFITASHLIECPENTYDDDAAADELSNESDSIAEEEEEECLEATKETIPHKTETSKRVILKQKPKAREQLVPMAKKRKAEQKMSSVKRGKLDDRSYIGGEDENESKEEEDDDDVMDDDDDDDDCKYQIAEGADQLSESGSNESSEVDDNAKGKKFKGVRGKGDNAGAAAAADDDDDEADDGVDDDGMNSEDDQEDEDESEDAESSPEKTILKKMDFKIATGTPLQSPAIRAAVEKEKIRKLSNNDKPTSVQSTSNSRRQKKLGK